MFTFGMADGDVVNVVNGGAFGGAATVVVVGCVATAAAAADVGLKICVGC